MSYSLVHAEQNMTVSNEEIFNWVASKLKIDNDYPLPEIQFVSKERLQDIFRKTNKESFKRWAGKYGEKKANELVEFYLREVIGLFIPKTCSLYIGDFIDPCKRNSIIAHELTHYFQHVENSSFDFNKKGADSVYLFNELQAGSIERTFMEAFCGQTPSN
jgi:hypothetical protein